MVFDGMQKIKIGGLQKSSLIDYPGRISAIVFTQGCNFRCPYCHNPELIAAAVVSEWTSSSVLDFLKTRVGKLDAVVITGGEPCLQDGLEAFISEIKSLGFLVKLDTNGSYPDVLKKILDAKLVDYVAMDIKAPLEKYSQVVCCEVDTSSVLKSIKLLKKSGVDCEFRTTVVKSQLNIDDFEKIGNMISGGQKYYLQKFVPTKTLNKKFLDQETYTDEEFEQIKMGLNKHIKEVYVR
jgi:pyruvate formate lyase activating enzyme